MKKQLNAPLYNALRNYSDKAFRFHTPGHSGKDLDDFLYRSALADVTELSFSDNLQCPSGVIADAERLAAAKYGSARCLFFAGGATQAVFTALMTARIFSDTLYVLGSAHKSVFSGARLAGLKTETFADVQSLFAALKKRPAAVFATIPDYFGVRNFASDVEEIKNRARLFIVDEAHGSHFVYSSLLPETLAGFADMCVSSFHKTLPVFTGGAALHVNNAECEKACVFYRSETVSTSPSYLALASSDYARAYMEINGEKLYKNLFNRIKKCKKSIHKAGFTTFENDDFTRLVVKSEDAAKLSDYLGKKGFFAEAAIGDKLVFIATPFNAEFLSGLASAFSAMPKKVKRLLKGAPLEVIAEPRVSDFKGKIIYLDPDVAEGRLLATEITLYPPSTPVAFEGSRLSRAAIEFIVKYKERITGLTDGKVAVYEEEK